MISYCTIYKKSAFHTALCKKTFRSGAPRRRAPASMDARGPGRRTWSEHEGGDSTLAARDDTLFSI